MLNISLEAKKLAQATLDRLMAETVAHYSKAGQPVLDADGNFLHRGSTGCDNSVYEVICRHLFNSCGLRKGDNFARKAEQDDVTVYLNGKRFRIEIKSGSDCIVGMIPAMLGDHISRHTVDEILPKADLVCFAARVHDFEDLDDLLDESLVMTREEFIQFCITYSGTRKQAFETAFKLGVNGTSLRKDNKDRKAAGQEGRWTNCIVLQPAYAERRAQAITDNFEYMTLRAWLEENGRA